MLGIEQMCSGILLYSSIHLYFQPLFSATPFGEADQTSAGPSLKVRVVARTHVLVGVLRLDGVERRQAADERRTAARHDALLDGSARRVQRVRISVFLLVHLHLA